LPRFRPAAIAGHEFRRQNRLHQSNRSASGWPSLKENRPGRNNYSP